MLFSTPSASQASRIYSAGVKPVPSSRAENRRMPMVLVRAEEVAILRPPSSNDCVTTTVLYYRVKFTRVKTEPLKVPEWNGVA